MPPDDYIIDAEPVPLSNEDWQRMNEANAAIFIENDDYLNSAPVIDYDFEPITNPMDIDTGFNLEPPAHFLEANDFFNAQQIGLPFDVQNTLATNEPINPVNTPTLSGQTAITSPTQQPAINPFAQIQPNPVSVAPPTAQPQPTTIIQNAPPAPSVVQATPTQPAPTVAQPISNNPPTQTVVQTPVVSPAPSTPAFATPANNPNMPSLDDIHYKQMREELLSNQVDSQDMNLYLQIVSRFTDGLTGSGDVKNGLNDQKGFFKAQFTAASKHYQDVSKGKMNSYIAPSYKGENMPGFDKNDTKKIRDIANVASQTLFKTYEDDIVKSYDDLSNHLQVYQTMSPAQQQTTRDFIDALTINKNNPLPPADSVSKPFLDFAQGYVDLLATSQVAQEKVYGKARNEGIAPSDINQQAVFLKADKAALETNSEMIAELKRMANKNDAFGQHFPAANMATNEIQTHDKKLSSSYINTRTTTQMGKGDKDRYDSTWGASNFLEFKNHELKRLQYEEKGLEFNKPFEFKPTVTYAPDGKMPNDKVTEPNKAVLNYDDWKDRAAEVAKEAMQNAKAKVALNTIGIKKSFGFYTGLNDTDKQLFNQIMTNVSDANKNTVNASLLNDDAALQGYANQREVVEQAIYAAQSIQGVNDAYKTIYGWDKNAPKLQFNIEKSQNVINQADPFGMGTPSQAVNTILNPAVNNQQPKPQANNPNNFIGTPQGQTPQYPNMQHNGMGGQVGVNAFTPPSNPHPVAQGAVSLLGGLGYVLGSGTASLFSNIRDGIKNPVAFNIPGVRHAPSIDARMAAPNAFELTPATVTNGVSPIAVTHNPSNVTPAVPAGITPSISATALITTLPYQIQKDDTFDSHSVRLKNQNNPKQNEPITIDYLFKRQKALGMIEEKAELENNPLVKITNIHNDIIANTTKLAAGGLSKGDENLILEDMAVKYSQFDTLLNDKRHGLAGKIKKQINDPNYEVNSIGILQAGIVDKVTDNLKKTLETSEANNLFDPKAIKVGKNKDKEPNELLDKAKNSMSELATSVGELFNKIAQAVSALKPATPSSSPTTASPSP